MNRSSEPRRRSANNPVSMSASAGTSTPSTRMGADRSASNTGTTMCHRRSIPSARSWPTSSAVSAPRWRSKVIRATAPVRRSRWRTSCSPARAPIPTVTAPAFSLARKATWTLPPSGRKTATRSPGSMPAPIRADARRSAEWR